MAQAGLESVDAVVVGANIRGLITAYLLGQLGYRAVLLERGAAGGGVDGSFLTAEGTRFDRCVIPSGHPTQSSRIAEGEPQ